MSAQYAPESRRARHEGSRRCPQRPQHLQNIDAVAADRETAWQYREAEILQQGKAVGLTKWQGTQQQCVDYAKDSGTAADAEGESEHGDGGEAGGFAQHAQAVANVLYVEIRSTLSAHGVIRSNGRIVGISGQSLPIFAPLPMIDVLRGDVDTVHEGRFSMSYDSFCRTFRTA